MSHLKISEQLDAAASVFPKRTRERNQIEKLARDFMVNVGAPKAVIEQKFGAQKAPGKVSR